MLHIHCYIDLVAVDSARVFFELTSLVRIMSYTVFCIYLVIVEIFGLKVELLAN